MKIVLFFPSLENGGAERVMLLLSNAFIKQGHTVSLFLMRGGYSREANLDPQISLRIAKNKNPFFVAMQFWLFCREQKPDVVLSTIWHCNFVNVFCAILGKHKAVVRESTYPKLLFQGQSLFAKFAYAIYLRTYRLASAVISPNAIIGSYLSSVYGIDGKKIHVIVNPIDLDEIHASKWPSNIPSFNPDNFNIVSVSRLSAVKRLDNLIKACSNLKHRKNWRLYLVGEGPHERDLRDLAEKCGVSDQVSFCGHIPKPYRMMSEASLFVLSSEFEGMPNSLLEAFCAGANIVATDCLTGPRQILEGGKFGALVPVGDVAALANAIDSFEPSCYAYSRACEKYSLDSVASKYLSVCKELI